MLPMNVSLRIKDGNGKRINLWLPLFLFWPILIALCILFLPIYGLWQVCQRGKMPKIPPLLSAILGLLNALRGLMIDIENKENKVKVIIN